MSTDLSPAETSLKEIRSLIIDDRIDQAKESFSKLEGETFATYDDFNRLGERVSATNSMAIFHALMTVEEFTRKLFERINSSEEFIRFLFERPWKTFIPAEELVAIFHRVKPTPTDWVHWRPSHSWEEDDGDKLVVLQMLEATEAPFSEWHYAYYLLYLTVKDCDEDILLFSPGVILLRDLFMRKMQEALKATPNPFLKT